MIWLSWRQERLEAALAAGLLALVALLLIPAGIHMASVYSSSGTAACLAHTAASGAGCGNIVDAFQHQFEHAGPIVPWLNFLPGLFGVFVAAPLILEFEHGTYRLAWTQSVTRRRWLSTKLLAVYGSALLAAVVLTVLMTWWREPLDHLQGRMEPNVFDFEGIVPYAYTVFAVSLVLAIGIFTRRTVVAIAGGLLGYFVARIGVQTWIREHYVAPIKRVWAPGRPGPTNLDHAWNIVSGPSNAAGVPLPFGKSSLGVCLSAPKNAIESCLRAHHIYNIAVYQPASRFWLFQGIEAGLFAGVAVVLLAAALWWVTRRLA
jgi:hypothetical protein